MQCAETQEESLGRWKEQDKTELDLHEMETSDLPDREFQHFRSTADVTCERKDE